MPATAVAGTVLAVASSFAPAARALLENTPQGIHLIASSSGTLFSQIVRGAPYDVVILADDDWTLRLEQALGGSRPRKCIAQAATALWAPDLKLPDSKRIAAWLSASNHRMVLPNPATAPAGRLALQLLKKWKIKNSNIQYARSASHAAAMGLRRAADIILLPLPLALEARDKQSSPPAKHDAGIRVAEDCCQLAYHALLLNDTAEARQLFGLLLQKSTARLLQEKGFGAPGNDCAPARGISRGSG